MSKKILILGVNGFIGSALSEAILEKTDWQIIGMDIQSHKIGHLLNKPNFSFTNGDITANDSWVEDAIVQSDVVLPLVAIANPSLYVSDPLRVFELDFEANLKIVKLCVKYNKRVIFPSTSEVYGMSTDEEFDEDTSNFVLGPTSKQRWIYSCSKQMLDRVIFAYGIHKGLDYTLFRPFNWLGPKLDEISPDKNNSSRVVTQFIANMLYHKNIKLVDGGMQRRSFTCIDDGIDALLKIIENKDGKASGQIFNIGNPKNDVSIKDLSQTLIDLISKYPGYENIRSELKVEDVRSADHYGKHYQDVGRRVPSIKKAKELLGWEPTVDLASALKKTLDYHVLGHHLSQKSA